MERRNFIKLTGLLTGNLAFLNSGFTSNGSDFTSDVKQLDEKSNSFWKVVRQQFLLPADYAYFNTGGLGASPVIVLDEVYKAMREREIKPAPGIDMEKWNQTKTKIAEMIQAEMAEIALTNSATDGNNIILNGLPFKEGDEIITSSHEHSGLIVPLANTAKRRGVKIKSFDPDLKDGLNNVNRIEKLITSKTRLIFVSHFTCTTGQRFPEKEIVKLAREHGFWVAFDGAQTAGNMPIFVHDYDCDFYATCCHKWMLGPKRTGFLYVKKSKLDLLAPTTVGAYSERHVDLDAQEFIPFETAQRYEYATQNDALYIGLATAIDFARQIGFETIWQRNKALAEMFYAGLTKIPAVEILSPQEETFRTSMITFKPKNKDYGEVASTLSNNNYRVRMVGEANLGGVRVSCHLYNNEDEIDRLLYEIKNVTA